MEKNIVNKSARTSAADSWRGDIIEFPINGPPLSEAEQGSYNCTRDIVSSQITSLGVNENTLSAPSCDQGIGMVGDPTTQDNISIWLVWTVRQRIKLALCHVHSQSLSFCLPLEITMIYDEDRNLVIFDNFHQGQCHGHWSSWWFLSPLKLSKVRGIVIESQKDCYWKSEGLQWKGRRNPFVIPPRVQSTERPQGHTPTMISRVFPILIVTHWDGFGICKEKHQLNQVLSLQQCSFYRTNVV